MMMPKMPHTKNLWVMEWAIKSIIAQKRGAWRIMYRRTTHLAVFGLFTER